MPFQLSPGVNVTEIDLTTIVPAVATTDAAIAGVFRWGPVDKPLLVSNENQLRDRYGRPTNLNAETFFTAASFLAYSNRLWVNRAAKTTGYEYQEGGAVVETGNTVIGGISNTSIAVGDYVFGPGIEAGTTVTSVDDLLSNSEITIDKAPTTSGTVQLNIFEPGLTFNAITNTAPVDLVGHIVKNEDHYETAKAGFDAAVEFIARYPGELGNSLEISVCETADAFSSVLDLGSVDGVHGSSNVVTTSFTFTVGSNTAVATASGDNANPANAADDASLALDSFATNIKVGDYVRTGNAEIGYQYLKVTAIPAAAGNVSTGESTLTIQFDDRFNLSENIVTKTLTRFWGYFDLVGEAPGQSDWQRLKGNPAINDEVHVVVVDKDGRLTGVAGTILEVYQNLSRATDAKTSDGSTNYITDVINISSNYVWHNDEILLEDALNLTASTETAPSYRRFIGGTDSLSEGDGGSLGDVLRAYDVFQNSENYDISLILTGKSRGSVAGSQVGNYLIDNIAERRKDCVAFISPEKNAVVSNTNGDIEQDVVTFRNALRSTSYAVLDSGYKYMYDKYNDIYRWVPLNGDIAGLCAQTDDTRDPWWSPAGFNRGHIKNVIKLAWNPNKAQRDILYKSGVNPVVNFPGQGIVLYGDKTLLARPSAFDRINVRRLFIVLEKAIAVAARSLLFEFNDEFTRATFVNLVTPFLRDVQGRRGIYDFHVVADETNNTGEVIDRNEFVGDIYIKPARSINFIQLNFVAVRTGVEFEEVIGNF